MLDPKLLRQDLSLVAKKLSRRGFVLDEALYHDLENQRKQLQVTLETLQSERNRLSKSIGQAKAAGKDAAPIMAEVNAIGDKLKETKAEFEGVQEKFDAFCANLPNIPDDSVPDGKDEEDNVQVRTWGDIPKLNFEARDHVSLGEKNNWLDFEKASALTGSRFVVMRKGIAKLHRALAQFMLDVQTEENGYTECNVPFIVNGDTLYGTAQLPKFADDQFKMDDERDFYLIPTAEVVLTNLARDEILSEAQLPLQLTAHTPCFRKEAGSYGKDTRGMIRQHQFEKVELVWITTPDKSHETLETLTGHAESILQKLELPYRVVTLCTGDLGNSAVKTYDLEVWLPGQNKYREISSCSNCEDFQARRMGARFRRGQGDKPELVHTLNGSGLAVGRALVAVMENYQDADGNIRIPKVLQPYMGGQTILT